MVSNLINRIGVLNWITMVVWVVGIVLCGASFIRADHVYKDDLRVRVERINAENSNAAHALGQNVNRTFAQADSILLFMKTAIEANGVVDPAHLALLKTFPAKRSIAQIAVADARGDLIFSAAPMRAPLNIADRAHFQVHSKADTGKIFIAIPKIFELGTTQAIFLSRRVNDAKGNFAGIVSVGLDPEYFTEEFVKMDLGPEKSIVLMRTDGSLLARVPTFPPADRAGYYRSHVVLSYLEQGRTTGVYESPGVEDIPRMAAFQALPDYPAVVMVGIPKAIALSDVVARQKDSLYREMKFSGAVLLGLVVITWLGRKYGKAQIALVSERNAYRELIVKLREEIEEEYRAKERITEKLNRLDRLNLVGEMAASIGHEVRNPLTTVRGYLQFFQGKGGFAQYKVPVDLMIEELDRANSIISEFLSLAKNKKVDLRPGSLNEALLAIKPMLEADAIRRSHELELDLHETPDIIMDDGEIRQLVINLVRNGLEAMSEPGRLTIRTFMSADEVTLSVTDSGSGISPQEMEKLGTPFFTTKDNGTGLGLAVSYRIVERHQASISFDSSAMGTTVIIRFQDARPMV